MANSGAFELVRVKLEAAKAVHLDELNRQLYADAGPHAPLPPLTWRDRLRRRALRACAYVATVWRAVKGDDPYDVEPEDY